ncbi:MAG: SIMPL domain-containing protein [Bacteroidales bacterium]|nr:SIMPL domain-containing protein [Bacteroidales bacterium]MBQ9313187.1 SIMPL domain-containing protein [Bacteroidales bacterium]
MKKFWKKIGINSIWICLGLCICGYFIYKGLKTFSDKERTVYVKGLSEKIVEADYATMTITYTLGGNEMQEVLKQIEANNNKIKSFIKSKGIDEKDITVSTPMIKDKTNTEWAEDTDRKYTYRYFASVNIAIASNKTKAVREVEVNQFDLFKEGIQIQQYYYDDNSAKYEFTNINDLKPSMIKEAAANAKKAATELSANTGSKIGNIKSASQGQIDVSTTQNPLELKVRVVSTIEYFLK